MTESSGLIRGLEGVVAAETQLCDLDGANGRLAYRGYDIADLARQATLRAGRLPAPATASCRSAAQLDGFVVQLTAARAIPAELVAGLPADAEGHRSDARCCRPRWPSSGMFDPDTTDNSHAANVRKAVRLTSQFATAICAHHRVRQGKEPVTPAAGLSHAANFLYMLTGERPNQAAAKAFDASLTLYAEHELNASTFTTRAIVSTQSDMHSAVAGGVGALKGPLHGGAGEAVMRTLMEIGEVGQRRRLHREGAGRQAALHGHGPSRLQGRRPARGHPARHGRGGVPAVGAVQVVRDGRRSCTSGSPRPRGSSPTSTSTRRRSSTRSASRSTSSRRSSPPAASPAGAANIVEQHDDNRLIRPRADYVGPKRRTYVERQAIETDRAGNRLEQATHVLTRASGPRSNIGDAATGSPMRQSLTRKLIESHLVAGRAVAGEEVGIGVDQVLLTDTNGTQAWLQFEALGFPRVVPARAVTYIDHQVYQTDSRNTDDHRYLQTVSRKYGATFSKLGNGICHQVHMESFSVPGQTLLGTDSHTPLCGAAGMLAIGAGGLDVAVAMGGGPYSFRMPAVVRVWLTGALQPWVTAKDVILELLRRLTVRGRHRQDLRVRRARGCRACWPPQRMTIANMGAELGLTTSVFASDEVTRSFLTRLGRGDDWRPAAADDDATYDDQIELDLSAIVPARRAAGLARPRGAGRARSPGRRSTR